MDFLFRAAEGHEIMLPFSESCLEEVVGTIYISTYWFKVLDPSILVDFTSVLACNLPFFKVPSATFDSISPLSS
jgi:hypothetical protein